MLFNLMEFLEKVQIEEQFINYIYLYTIINEFVDLAYNIYSEEKKKNLEDDKIRENVKKLIFIDSAKLMVNISRIEIKDENLAKMRKEKIIKFLKLETDNDAKKIIIDKVKDKFDEMDKLLTNNTLFEELMGQTFKYFSKEMCTIIFKLFNQIIKIQNIMEVMKNDMNKMKNKLKEMENKLNDIYSSNQILKKKSKEKDEKIDIINKKLEEKNLDIQNMHKEQIKNKEEIQMMYDTKLEEKEKEIVELKKDIINLKNEFNGLKKETKKLIEKDKDMESIFKEKNGIISNIINLINN